MQKRKLPSCRRALRAMTKSPLIPQSLICPLCLPTCLSPRLALLTKACAQAGGWAGLRLCQNCVPLCTSIFTALCYEDTLIVGNEFFQCLGFCEYQVRPGTTYHFLQLFTQPLLPLWLRLLVIDGSGPHGWFSMSYIGAFTEHLVLVGCIHDADN